MTLTCTDVFLAIWGAMWGLAALGVGIYIAVRGLVSVGAMFSAGGLFLLGVDTWIYYLRGIRHGYEGNAGELHLSGPIVM